jgi:hypothetical protein
MTLQDLLQEATQLSLKEKLQLATQLLHLVDLQIANSEASAPENSDNIDAQEGSIGYLMAHPISVRDFEPLSRDEIYDR